MTGGPGPFEGPRVKSRGVLQKSLVLTSVPISPVQEGDDKIEYRAWNPFRSKLAAAILGGVDQIHIKPGAKVLYLGAASGTTVSHVSDIVGPVSRQGQEEVGGRERSPPLPAWTQRPWLLPCTKGLGARPFRVTVPVCESSGLNHMVTGAPFSLTPEFLAWSEWAWVSG